GLGALSTFAAGYAFETRSLASVEGHPRYEGRSGETLDTPAIRSAVLAVFGAERGVPLLTAIKGLDFTLSEAGSRGHRSYLLGETTPEVVKDGLLHYSGWKTFYLVVLLQKLPLATLALVLAGLVAAVWPGRWSALDRVFLLAFPAVVLVQFSLGNAQLGVKYVLPAFPFLFLVAGLAAARAPWLGVAAVALCALESLAVFPDSAMFASVVAGGAENGHRVAVVGDDWGQDAPGLALFARDLDAVGAALEAGGDAAEEVGRFVREHGHELRIPSGAASPSVDESVRTLAREVRKSPVAYRYYGEGDPTAFGYDFAPLAGPRRGLVAVHAANLHREVEQFGWLERFDPAATEGEPMPGVFGRLVRGRWIVGQRPVAKIGRAIFVYSVGG
ncbi:MAG TPA: hypothetical protein VKE69_10745, partial [Planctomycetota bacterium]|nr:hypothetical protein [Planctomycetota bacterium]